MFQGVHLGEVALAEDEIFEILVVDLSMGPEESRALDARFAFLEKFPGVVLRLGKRIF